MSKSIVPPLSINIGRHGFQVKRATTATIAAGVIYLVSVRYLANQIKVKDAVRVMLTADPKHWIVLRVAGSHPFPTGRAVVNLLGIDLKFEKCG